MPPPEPLAGAPAVSALALDADHIVETIARLRRRIEERFPGSGLGRLCARLHVIGGQTRSRLERVEQPNLWLRGGTWVMVALVVAAAVAALGAVVAEVPEDSVARSRPSRCSSPESRMWSSSGSASRFSSRPRIG